MKKTIAHWICLFVLLNVGCCQCSFARDTVLVERGKAHAAIFVPARVMDDRVKTPEPNGIWHKLTDETSRIRLRESILDFVNIVERISGARLDVVPGRPGLDEKRLPILISEFAVERFGEPERKFPYAQGFRLVVSSKGVGLGGESDLATSYALYTLLDQLGCRWYMPSHLGEVLPKLGTIKLPVQDKSTGPSTIFRGLWYCDNDYARRNRLGGMELATNHILEATVPKKLRASNPEIRAVVGGKPHKFRVKWTHPLVSDAIADELFSRLQKKPETRTFSLSPGDGINWDESDDTKHDAGDFDTSTQRVSKTDRLMILANRVAGKIAPKYPDVKFGILAYVDYTRPPVREKVHPNVVPLIAPITFSRAQPMRDDGEPNNAALRNIVEGWAKVVPTTAYYFYAYFLAEVSSPNPMITKWGEDIPFVLGPGKCQYWQPETMMNFETSMHALYMGTRMAWDKDQKPNDIIDELHTLFYGNASREMAAYWHFVDKVWADTPEYAGGGFGHMRRWTQARTAQARKLMELARKKCKTKAESARAEMASLSLQQFEAFMQMRRDLSDGRWETLADDSETYRKRAVELGTHYLRQSAFGKMGWCKNKTINGYYFDVFYKNTYEDAARIAASFQVLTTPPLRAWRYAQDKEKKGEAAGWARPDYDDQAWKVTDPCVDTWSTLGHHNYMGSLWYRTRLELQTVPAGKKVFLWIGATDGRVKVFVNGKHVAYVDAKDRTVDSFSSHCRPVSFDVTKYVKSTGDNQISLLCTRESINELGTGGLIGPVALYCEKQESSRAP